MEAEKKAEALKLKVKVVSYADYLAEARSLLEKGPVNGMAAKFDIAVSLLYSRNEVIAVIQRGGETKFVCKA